MNRLNVPILYYHSITPQKYFKWFRNYLTLELSYFEEHLKYFKLNKYKSIFLNEYFDLQKTENIKDNYLLLTFDDGYVDNYIYVYPLLKKYGFKGTIFVSPDLVDLKSDKRNTLIDYWASKVSLKEIEKYGFLNWDEMREMEKSGVMDIQSHTLTHTKYFISDKLLGFHHPGVDCLYPIGNLFPERRPYYITDPEFEKLIPYGYPFFEEASSIIARKVSINRSFTELIIDKLKDHIWSKPYDFIILFNRIKQVYNDYKKDNLIIESNETEVHYKNRVRDELKNSKDILEKNLGKKIEYCCWPHGDNNEYSHKTALEIGYKMTSLGKMSIDYLDETRFDRFGLGVSKNNMFLTKLKMNYKMKSFNKNQPYYVVRKIYEFLRDNF